MFLNIIFKDSFMKAKTLIIATILSIALLTSCREQKEAEKEADVDVKIEKVEEQPEVDEAKKRQLDSIRQVKDHGHAH